MVSVYPSVTASSGGANPKPKAKPGTFKPGKSVRPAQGFPANDNIPVGKVPKHLMQPKLSSFNLPQRYAEFVVRKWQLGVGEAIQLITQNETNEMPSQYWTHGKWSCHDPAGHTIISSTLVGSVCVTNLAINNNWPPAVGPTTTASGLRCYRCLDLGPGVQNRWSRTYVGTYTRKAGAPVPTPTVETVVRAFSPGPLPLPLEWPLAQPQPRPKPTEWLAPLPFDEPAVEPEPKPEPKLEDPVVVLLPVTGMPFFRAEPPRSGRPIPVPPGTNVSPGPNPSVPVVTRSGRYGRKEPPSRRRDRRKRKRNPKVKMRPWVAAAIGITWAGVNTITEAMDFIKAMHDSIKDPGYKLSKKASKRQVIKYMTSNIEPWNHIDYAEAVQNYVNMQFGDWFSALGSASSKKVSQHLGMITGLDRTLAQHQSRLYEFANEEGVNPGDDIPELDIDMETGVISIGASWGSASWDLETNSLTVRR